LWKDDALPVYIMDNHRAALWCWMREMRPDARYAFIHVDYHWDQKLLAPPYVERIRDAMAEIRDDLGVFDALESAQVGRKGPFPMVRWDNYIDPFLALFPKVDAMHFAACERTDKVDRTLEWWRDRARGVGKRTPTARHYAARDFVSVLPDVLHRARSRTVINIDLDVFGYAGRRLGRSGEQPPLLSRSLSRLFAPVREHIGRAHAVTIALSPECCGPRDRGWDRAFALCACVRGARHRGSL